MTVSSGPALALVLAAAVILPAAAAGLLVAEHIAAPETESSADFQRLVGGLGAGPALDLSRCVREMDPRLGSECFMSCDPVLCSPIFCRSHASN